MKQKIPTDPEMMKNPKEPLWPLQGLCGWLGPDLSHCLLRGRHGTHRHVLWMGGGQDSGSAVTLPWGNVAKAENSHLDA